MHLKQTVLYVNYSSVKLKRRKKKKERNKERKKERERERGREGGGKGRRKEGKKEGREKESNPTRKNIYKYKQNFKSKMDKLDIFYIM